MVTPYKKRWWLNWVPEDWPDLVEYAVAFAGFVGVAWYLSHEWRHSAPPLPPRPAGRVVVPNPANPNGGVTVEKN